MYPLNMTLPAGGFAVANDAAEHQSLTAAGYVPPLVAEESPRAALIAELEGKGVKVDKRWSDARLAEEASKA